MEKKCQNAPNENWFCFFHDSRPVKAYISCNLNFQVDLATAAAMLSLTSFYPSPPPGKVNKTFKHHVLKLSSSSLSLFLFFLYAF